MAKTDPDDSVYVHPETGEKIPIPEGALVYRNEAGEITDWSNPPQYTGEELAPGQVPDYEPKFDPLGTTRRVLAFVTDEEHLGRPRNTVAVLTEDMASDPFTAIEYGEEDAVQKHLDLLQEAGLVEQRDDGTWAKTEAGDIEGRN